MLILLAGLLAIVAPLRAESPPTFVFQIDSSAVLYGFSPGFVALDASNNVYVTDDLYNLNNRVVKFTAGGVYLSQWGGNGSGNSQFSYPQGIAVDSSNNVFVVDTANNRIEKFDANGGYVTQWGGSGSGSGQFDYPQGVAVDSSNNVYVTDAENYRVDKFNGNGVLIGEWGSEGNGTGQFSNPTGIAVDSGNNVYVVDRGNARVEKFDENGNFLALWGSPGSGDGQFESPQGIAVDKSNNVYVADTGNYRVEKFDSGGNYLTQWGGSGTGNGQFTNYGVEDGPEGIALDSTGNFIYVADGGNNRIEVFVNDASLIPPYIVQQPTNQTVPIGTTVTLNIGVAGAALFFQWSSNNVALDGATNTAFTLTNVNPSDAAAYTVLVSNSYGSVLSSNAVLAVLPSADFVPLTFVFQIDSDAAPGGFEPGFLALDASNNVYVIDWLNNRVVKFTAGGAYLTQWGSPGSGDGQFKYLYGIAVDSGNDVYVVDSGNDRVEKFDESGGYVTQWGSFGTNIGQFYYPQGIAVDSGNNVYVTDYSSGRVEKFNGNGGYITQWGSAGSGNGEFANPDGIAVDSGNNVYVVDTGNDRIEKFDDNGNYLAQWGSFGTNIGQFYYPQGIAVDSGSNVYVTDSDNDRVEKFNGNGGYIRQWGISGSGIGQFSGPEGIAVDRAGNYIYVADTDNRRIEVFVNDTNIIPPYIVQQPTNQTVPVGTNATLTIGVVGTALSYQWSSNNVAVNGATNAAFTLTNVSLSDAGAYAVLVRNSYGSALSSNAVLEVLPAAEFVPPTFVFQIDSSAVPGGFAPEFVALDASNNLYVTCQVNYLTNRVVKFTAGGAYLSQWGAYGSGPTGGIAVDGSDNVYVADEYNDFVVKFTAGGTYLNQWGSGGSSNGQFSGPEGIAVDRSNNVYVVDDYNDRIEKFNGNGGYVTQWGASGSGAGQFSYPQGIAVDSGNNVYVVDADNGRVEKFDENGNYLAQWGSYGSSNGQFSGPEGIAVDRSNNVYVVDENNDRIEKFDSNGNYLAQWGSAGSGDGQLSEPIGIALDRTGNFIYVADAGNDRIEVFVNDTSIIPPHILQQPTNQTVPAGTNVTLSIGMVGVSFSYQWSSNNVAVDGATNAAFTLTNVSLSDSATYAVLVSNSYGSVLSSNAVLAVLPAADFVPPTFGFQIGSSTVPGRFAPGYVALDSGNNVYVTYPFNYSVIKFTTGGAYLTQWGSYGSSNGQFYDPEGIVVDSSNNVYVADSDNSRVEKFNAFGGYIGQWGSDGSSNGLLYLSEGIAVDSSNNVYVADYYSVDYYYDRDDRIEKFNSDGNYLTQWGGYGSGNGQFSNPEGIAVASGNNVFVVDSGNNRIERFDSDGNYLTQWGSYGSGNGQFSNPEGIAVDSGNNVYVVDSGNDRVEKFDSNGNYLTQWGSYGSGAGQLSGPVGIALDSTGNLIYVADAGNYRIEVFINNTSVAPPIITNEPASQIVPAGVSVTFGVGLVGSPPFVYQWSTNGVAVAGATNATFTLTNVSLSESGATCSVQVTNGYGSASSSDAVLTVLPILVTTQPASGLSATGAMLNGSVTLGSDGTVVWFEWGTDTNYGNIAGTTVVPGNNGSNYISATLSGLPGNFYHYRMVAANDFGIAYGQDQLFTVGLTPTATTLAAINGANGATLEAAVNPEGWNTTVYFQLFTPTLTTTTPGIDIGAGATSLDVNSFIPGLAPSAQYQYQVVASNALGTTFGEEFYWDQSAPAKIYRFSGSETNITLSPGVYIITAYGAAGGYSYNRRGSYVPGGLGAEMSAEFNFSASTNLTLLVGGGGAAYDGSYGGGGGGGGSFVVGGGTPLVIAGGGGGGGDYYGIVANGNVSADGDYLWGGGATGFNYSGAGGAGGADGGGGGLGIGIGIVFGGFGGGYIYGGGGGGGFVGDGELSGSGGSSFENGGAGGGGGYYNAAGGFGGGGGGGDGAPGGGGGYSGGGGGGYYGQYEPGYGGGGGSIIDSAAITILTEVSGASYRGEIIITTIIPPFAITAGAAIGFTNGMFGFNVSGPPGSNVVIQASTDLQIWIPLQTNLLGSGPLYFSDTNAPANVQRFYRAQLLP